MGEVIIIGSNSIKRLTISYLLMSILISIPFIFFLIEYGYNFKFFVIFILNYIYIIFLFIINIKRADFLVINNGFIKIGNSLMQKKLHINEIIKIEYNLAGSLNLYTNKKQYSYSFEIDSQNHSIEEVLKVLSKKINKNIQYDNEIIIIY